MPPISGLQEWVCPRTTGSGRFRYTLVSDGTNSVIQTFPPISDFGPITVSPPRMVAPE